MHFKQIRSTLKFYLNLLLLKTDYWFMKNKISLIACIVIISVFFTYRISYTHFKSEKPVMMTSWDALGYYIYLPAIFIYHDVSDLEWFPEIDKKYDVSGGWFYQARKMDNGKYFFKYLGGVAILQSPFFFIGHQIAGITNYKQDGFSAPYQYAIAFGVLFYFLLSLFLLRWVLLRYFNDITVSITLLLLILASNSIQYIAIDGGQSHGFIFPLYVLLLFTTIKWHEKPGKLWAALTGLIIGIAAISRPTEMIMIFIPLLWNTHTKEAAKAKWQLVKEHKTHLIWLAVFGFIGILPQLIYWKIATGSFIFDVGSKWDFLSPHFRVLFGWEKGWFIYTPVTILFVVGFFFMKKFPFWKSVLTFCLLNIYIIIAWHHWRYGGSYSTRALVQSYPIFALPLAAVIDRIRTKKWEIVIYVVGLYLIFVNLFQIDQYNKTILHYDDMNRKYYGSIYLNPNPDPLDMSLLDTDECLTNEKDFSVTNLIDFDNNFAIKVAYNSSSFLMSQKINNPGTEENWIKVQASIKAERGFGSSYIQSELQIGDSIKKTRIRIFSPISKPGQFNDYEFYLKVPEIKSEGEIRFYISTLEEFEGSLRRLKVDWLRK